MERRENSSRNWILFLFVIFFIWVFLQFLAPFALPNNSVNDLSGIVGVSDNEEDINEMPFPWGSIYGCGDRLCHQKADRSFFLNDNQMPFCSRCTAIWLGLAIGLGFMVFFKIELDWRFLVLIFVGLIPIGIDGVGQLFGFWESSNIVRFITGILIGFVCGIAIGLIVEEVRTLKIFNREKVKKKKM